MDDTDTDTDTGGTEADGGGETGGADGEGTGDGLVGPLDHVGIATRDAAGLAAQYGELLGVRQVHAETFDGLRVVFLDAGGAHLELLSPAPGDTEGESGGDGGGEEDGPVARFLDRSGPGLHHLAFRVGDVDRALDRARAAGVTPVDESGRPGAWGHTVAFLRPEGTGGVLVEFVETH